MYKKKCPEINLNNTLKNKYFLNYIVQQQLFKMNDTSVLYFQSQLHGFIYINKYTIYYYNYYYFFNIQTY